MTATEKKIDDALRTKGAHLSRLHAEAIQDWLIAAIQGDKVAAFEARKRLAEISRETFGVGELLGARTLLQSAAKVTGEQLSFGRNRSELITFALEPSQPLLPSVTFEEMVEDFSSRVPVVVQRAAERTAQEVARLYSQDRVVAFTRSAEAAVTKRAQEFIEDAMSLGLTEREAGRGLASLSELATKTAPWSESYARMAFRTNLNTATTAGRFRQARDPDIAEVIPAFRFDSVGDSDTRDNHDALDGIILKSSNPAWNRIAPPLGYNCRCQVSEVSRPELEFEGRINSVGDVIESKIPAFGGPDEGFRHGGRPDLFGPASSSRR